jgi:hypothetical protein
MADEAQAPDIAAQFRATGFILSEDAEYTLREMFAAMEASAFAYDMDDTGTGTIDITGGRSPRFCALSPAWANLSSLASPSPRMLPPGPPAQAELGSSCANGPSRGRGIPGPFLRPAHAGAGRGLPTGRTRPQARRCHRAEAGRANPARPHASLASSSSKTLQFGCRVRAGFSGRGHPSARKRVSRLHARRTPSKMADFCGF